MCNYVCDVMELEGTGRYHKLRIEKIIPYYETGDEYKSEVRSENQGTL